MKKKTKRNFPLNVCRSYVRKLNIGNFQTVDIFASFTQEVTTIEQARKMSRKLFHLAKSEVLRDVEAENPQDEVPEEGERDIEIARLADILEYNARRGIASSVTDYEKIAMFPEITKKINEAKKAFNRENRTKPKKELSRVSELKAKVAEHQKIKYGNQH